MIREICAQISLYFFSSVLVPFAWGYWRDTKKANWFEWLDFVASFKAQMTASVDG